MLVDAVFLTRLLLATLVGVTILAVVSLGLYVTFNLMRVINVAHGDFLMLGAYAQLVFLHAGVNFWLSLCLSAAVVFLVGVLVERVILRGLYVRGELTTLLATWGVSIVFQQMIRLLFGPQSQTVTPPITATVYVAGASYPAYPLLMVGVGWAVILLTVLALFRTSLGLRIRATMDHGMLAAASGIHTDRAYWLTFGLGAAIAGLAGALLAPMVDVRPTMGLDYVAKAFFVVIIGGTSSIWASLGGAGLIGTLESVVGVPTDPTVATIVILMLATLVLYARPEGLFGRVRRGELL